MCEREGDSYGVAVGRVARKFEALALIFLEEAVKWKPPYVASRSHFGSPAKHPTTPFESTLDL